MDLKKFVFCKDCINRNKKIPKTPELMMFKSSMISTDMKIKAKSQTQRKQQQNKFHKGLVSRMCKELLPLSDYKPSNQTGNTRQKLRTDTSQSTDKNGK